MASRKELDSVGKGMGLAMAASIFLEKAGSILKKDKLVYKHKVKQLLNNLLQENLSLIKGRELLYNLISSKETLDDSAKILGYTPEKDVVEDAFHTEQDLMAKMVNIYLNITSDEELYNAWVVVNELFEKRRVYTQGDLLHKLEVAIKDFANLTEINKEHLNKYL
jgi:hypothetical protein